MDNKVIGKKLKVSDFNMEFGKQAKMVNLICFYKYTSDNGLYAIYCDDTNIPYGILNYGTAHIKGDSLIVIGSKNPNQEMVKEFAFKLSNNEDISNFIVQDISNINSIELVSPNKIEIKKEVLSSLVDKTISKPVVTKQPKNKNGKKKSNVLLPILIVLIFVSATIYFFFFKTKEEVINVAKSIVCNTEYRSKELEANVIEDNTYNFNQDDKLEYVNKAITYKFDNEDEYLNFFDLGLQYEYVPDKNEGVVQDSENYTFKVITKEVVDDDYFLPTEYEKALKYYKDKGYKCIEQDK